MRTRLLRIFLLAAALSAAAWEIDFDTATKEGIPPEWGVDGRRFCVPTTRFSLEEVSGARDGRVLRVSAPKSTGALLTDLTTKVDLEKTPFLVWRWRVLSASDQACGTNSDLDDQPVAIYCGTGTLLRQKSIAYRWEYDPPAGTEFTRKYAGGMHHVACIVARDKTAPLGEWILEVRNLRTDFERIYHIQPDKLILSVCANSQYTESHSEAELDFIGFYTSEEAEALRKRFADPASQKESETTERP